jgi:uncharacterized SAM-binding protein YcdF (DUF218 family)
MKSDYIAQCLLLPPGSIIIIGCIAFFCSFAWRKVANFLLVTAIIILYILSIPYTPVELAKPLQIYPAINVDKIYKNNYTDADTAIVVLSGGRYFNAPEYGGDTASTISLLRLRYAAKLHQATNLPILISGGAQSFGAKADAQLMEEALEQGFQTKAKWLESRSANTWQNANYSVKILKMNHIKRILLVTSAIHMRRSVFAFQNQGIEVIPAPTYFIQQPNLGASIYQLMPNRFAFFTSTQCLYEYLGLIWYYVHHE